MNTTLLIIVLILGVVLLALEIVALPGGIAGAFGVGLIGFGVWQTYALFGNQVGTIVLLCAIALCVYSCVLCEHKILSGNVWVHQTLCLICQKKPSLLSSGPLVCHHTDGIIPIKPHIHTITRLTASAYPSGVMCCRQLPSL